MAKRIGILGGISHESTIRYYKFILKKYYARQRNYHYPEVVIFSLDLSKLIGFEERDDLDGYVRYLTEGLKSLEKAGADFVVMAANSPHAVKHLLKMNYQLLCKTFADHLVFEPDRAPGLKKKSLFLFLRRTTCSRRRA